jgi:hypothetical protein
MGVNIFQGYGFEIAKPGGFVPVAISTGRAHGRSDLSDSNKIKECTHGL